MANQYNSEHNIKTLPKWAQQHIACLDQLNDYLEHRNSTLENMHAIMCEPKRNWFTLPFSYDDEKTIHLWLLEKDQPVPVCALSKGDLLFVGRAKKENG